MVHRSTKELKLATIHKLSEIIRNGKSIVDNEKNIHNDSSRFAYFKTKTEINGTPCTITFDVKKTTAKNKFWIHYINIKKKMLNYSLLRKSRRSMRNSNFMRIELP